MNPFNEGVSGLFSKRSADQSGLLTSLFGGFYPSATTAAGKKINQSTSLKLSAFYCALTTLAESFATLPKSVYQEKGNKRGRVRTHPVDYLLHKEPHPFHTAFIFDFIMVLSYFLKGNAYALIIRDKGGNVTALKYLDADYVEVIEHVGKIFYKYKQAMFTQAEIIHVPAFCTNGLTGRSIIQFAADSMGVSYAAQEYGASAYNNKGKSQGVLETDLSVKPDAKGKIRDAFSTALADDNPYRTAVLDEGFKYKPITLSPEQSKFIEAKVEGTADIARWFKIPLHKLHVSGEGGYNFLVQMSSEYLQTGVQPIADRFKQEYDRKLFTRTEINNGFYTYNNYEKLLQVDPKARSEFYKNLYYMGVLNPDEIRAKEDMNPREDGAGKDYMQQVNLLSQKQIEKTLEDA